MAELVPAPEPAPVKVESSDSGESPLLRGSRSLWAASAVMLGALLIVVHPPLPLPNKAVHELLPFLTWDSIGWVGIGVVIIICCLIRGLREKVIIRVADQLTDLVFVIVGGLLDLAAHWQRQARRWAAGLVVSSIVIFPVGYHAYLALSSLQDRLSELSEFRLALQRFVCYGRLQGGNEIELSRILNAYGPSDKSTLDRFCTPELRVIYKRIEELYRLHPSLEKADFEGRRRMISDFWSAFVNEPSPGKPPATPPKLNDHLAFLALRARAHSFLAMNEGKLETIAAAEQDYEKLKNLALNLADKEQRQRFVGLAFNGLGILQAMRYRQVMADIGREAEKKKASYMSKAYSHYLASVDSKKDGDDGEDSQKRKANNEADLELYLLREALAANDDFYEALDHSLYEKYVEFRDNPAFTQSWAKTRADSLEQRARSTRNPIFFVTVSQINALYAETLLRRNPGCLEQLEYPRESQRRPACVELERTLRNGWLNMATALYLGQSVKELERDPRRGLICIYFSNPITKGEAEFLFNRFKMKPNTKLCS